MKKVLNEIQRLQKIAGLLKEEEDISLSDTPEFNSSGLTPEGVRDMIEDWAWSGQGTPAGYNPEIDPAEGLKWGEEEIKAAILNLNRRDREVLSSLLNNTFETADGWTNGDKKFLNSLGLNITADPLPTDLYDDI